VRCWYAAVSGSVNTNVSGSVLEKRGDW